jgi:type I restriction enzyme S subunit
MKPRVVVLSDVAIVNPRMPKSLAEDQAQSVAFVPMASVSEKGVMSNFAERPLKEVAKGFTYFETGDVLVAKITPCMENGKACLVPQLPYNAGFGSTEFHVLRATEAIDPRYLFHSVWNAKFRQAAERNMTGSAGQKRVPSHFFNSYKIPLPPLPEQKRIAAILDKADEIRRKREKAIELTDSFLRSVFLEMFEHTTDFPQVTVRELAEVKGGKRLPKGADYEDSPTSHPYIRVVDFKNKSVDSSNLRFISEEIHRKVSRYTISSKDVYISIAGTIGLVGTIPDELSGANLTENAAKLVIKNNSVLPGYLCWALSSPMGQAQIRAKTMATSQPKLALFRIEEIQVPLPPLHKQQQFIQIAQAAESLLRRMDKSLISSSRLAQSLTSSLLCNNNMEPLGASCVNQPEVAHAL